MWLSDGEEHEHCQTTNVSFFFCILTWSTNCAISLRYESISAVTKVTTLCVNALMRTSAIFVFALVNICVK